MSDWTDTFFKAPASYRADDGIVLCGDFRAILREFPSESVDHIFTDVDYTNLLGFWGLARLAPRIMKPGAALIMEVPHTKLLSVQQIFQLDAISQGLLYRWQYCFLYLKGRQRRLRMGIRVLHKPLLCYYKPKWINRGFVKDAFAVEPVKRTKHKWQKNLDGYMYYIEHHTDKGGIVLDPCVGSGTTALACRKLGRRFVVIDIDAKLCNRIAEELSSPSRGKFPNKSS